MFSEKRLITGGMLAALAAVWVLVALTTQHGFTDLVWYIGPAGLLAVAVAWLFFTFAGELFTWPRAVVSVVLGAAVLSPVLAYFFSGSKDQDLIAKFFFMIAVGWAASLGGILWSLGAAASDALKEWLSKRKVREPRTVLVPV